MLLNTIPTFKEGDIILFRLDTGEEILARVKTTTSHEYLLEKPLKVVMLNGNIGMHEYSIISDNEKGFVLRNSHVVGYSYPGKDAENHFIQHASGIQLATL